jgi:hypothetical protein
MQFRKALLATALILTTGFTGAAIAQNAAVSQTRGPIYITVPASASVLESIEVKPPAAGFITVTVTGSFVFETSPGVAGNYCLQLSQTANYIGGCIPDTGSDSAIRNYISSGYPATVPGFGQSEQYSIVRTYGVAAGENFTFYLNGYQNGFAAGYLFQPSITALYVPGTMAP